MVENVSRSGRVLVCGGHGFLGSHVVDQLRNRGYNDLIIPRSSEFDLREQVAVRSLFETYRPRSVINLAGLVGGILVNKQRPADFFYDNLMIGTLVMHEACRSGVEKYLVTIGGCSYPATAPSPIREEDLWNGYPQPESAPYSLAKKMSVVQAEACRRQYGFNAIVMVPGNLYGPRDNFDLNNSHVVPALIRKFIEAKRDQSAEVVVWGSGKPVRDFVYVEDVAEALILSLENYNGGEIINISSGMQTTIRELVEIIAELTGFHGQVVWDTSNPDGQMLKGFDIRRMREWLGHNCGTSLRDGLRKTIEWFKTNYDAARFKT